MTARVIAATSRGLLREVREGRFRADLYFRLNVSSSRLPPLRERRERHRAAGAGAAPAARGVARVPRAPLADAVFARLAARAWPGNVRELMNVLERC